MDKATAWLASDPPRPAPALMTTEEAALYLRLSEQGFARYRGQGLIRGAKVGRRVLFRQRDLDEFVAERMD